MTIDEKIDKVLDYYKSQQEYTFANVCEEILDEGEYGPNHDVLYREMEKQDLICKSELQTRKHRITANGRRIIERGGWLKHLQDMGEEKTKSEWRETKRWRITTAISGVSIVLSVVALYLSSSINGKESEFAIRLSRIDTTMARMDDRLRPVETTGKTVQALERKVDSLARPPKPVKK